MFFALKASKSLEYTSNGPIGLEPDQGWSGSSMHHARGIPLPHTLKQLCSLPHTLKQLIHMTHRTCTAQYACRCEQLPTSMLAWVTVYR